MQIYERLISMFIQQMADKLVQLGPLRNGEHEVLMMLDEFGNGGRIDTVLTLAPLIRKNGVRFVFILQDGAQLERLYQRSGQKILMGASTIKLFMNFQSQEDATAVSMAAGKTTEWVEQSSYSHRHGRRQRSISKVPVSVDLLPVNTLMMMKPEEAILQVTGMPLMRIMKLDSGGERMFAKVRKFGPVSRPCMEPVEWTIGHRDAAVTPSRQANDERFIVKDGVRHVYISSLDELRDRLDLDEMREVGVADDDASAAKQKQRRKEPASGSVGRRRQDSPLIPHDPDRGPDDLKIDERRLADNVYSGSPARNGRRRQGVNQSTDHAAPRFAGAGVLRRQEVREAFGSDLRNLTDVIFEQTGELSLEPTDLNSDVDLLIGTLSNRLTEASSLDYLHQFARVARDPLDEDVEQLDERAE